MVFCALIILSTSVVALGYTGSHQAPKESAITASARLLFGTSQSASLNWAGYAVVLSSGTVSAVTESFVVPDPVVSSSPGNANSANLQYKPGGNGHSPGGGPPGGGGSSSTSYAAFWAGMDGYSSSTVEQAGILMNVSSSGTTTYAAWTEFYPAAPTYAPASFGTIGVGDTITVTVTSSGGFITASVADGSHTYSNTVSATGYQRNSAEWIAEAPSSGHSILPLADFVSVGFGALNSNSAVTNSATVTGAPAGSSISALSSDGFSVYQINMVQRNGALKASTGGLESDGSSFIVTWYSS